MAATDAPGSFGFGLCIANCPPELSRQVASLGGVSGHHLRLEHLDGDPEERPRSGVSMRIGLPRSAFKQILAVRGKRADHSGWA